VGKFRFKKYLVCLLFKSGKILWPLGNSEKNPVHFAELKCCSCKKQNKSVLFPVGGNIRDKIVERNYWISINLKMA